ncbi:probable G-protein coupled receptor 21 isoform X2 [Atheta coriaria]|uniref:probable G-protein coupled receptor 21 isoform X2 n=1 Tax=Dalotia coriaria TaxID=877792 RepID=UPI0031F3B9A6
MHHKTTILVAPALQNSSCTHPRYHNVGLIAGLGPAEFVQGLIVFLITLGVLLANLLLILVINSRRYSKYIHSQALLRGAISQQSAVILICMAMDRYLCMLHPARYHKHSSKKGCVAIISMTWIMSVTLFAILVLPRGGFYFNPTGMSACEPFYAQASLRILAACGFYFPTTMILMYCYGSAFHVNKLRLRKAGCNTIASPDDYGGQSVEKLVCQERRLSTNASRTMAAMSLGFIVLVTPWTIQEVVAACTGSRAPAALDFIATWLALSNSFWNPFLYWLLNNQFRRISRELLFGRFCCSKPKEEKQHNCSSNSSSIRHGGHTQGCDLEGLSEKYWGEILERTLSSSSLHNLQRNFHHGGHFAHAHHHHHHARCNGVHEMRMVDAAVPDL